jgi:hypothetical protein
MAYFIGVYAAGYYGMEQHSVQNRVSPRIMNMESRHLRNYSELDGLRVSVLAAEGGVVAAE